jgi:hypothetical protein
MLRTAIEQVKVEVLRPPDCRRNAWVHAPCLNSSTTSKLSTEHSISIEYWIENDVPQPRAPAL